jgi:hypothetical protein
MDSLPPGIINEDPLDILTLKARVATPVQLREVASKATLDRKVKERWFAKYLPLAKFDPLPGPPLAWAFPGDSRWAKRPPEVIIAEAKARWESLTLKTWPVYVATEHAAKHTGGIGNGEIRQPMQVSHDLYVTTVYLHQEKKIRDAWRGEDLLRADGWDGIVPDGFAVVDGMPLAFEIVGESYTADRIMEFQNHCYREGWGYQIW